MSRFNIIRAAGIIAGSDGDDFIFATGNKDTINTSPGLDIIKTGDGYDWINFWSEEGTTIVLDFDVGEDNVSIMYPYTITDTGDNLRFDTNTGASLILLDVDQWW